MLFYFLIMNIMMLFVVKLIEEKELFIIDGEKMIVMIKFFIIF